MCVNKSKIIKRAFSLSNYLHYLYFLYYKDTTYFII
nr:MAG TPA: hypothetical protein [Caudoviricetes sp.]